MLRLLLISAALVIMSPTVFAEDADDAADAEAQAEEVNGDGIEKPKTLSGMSILGNEEAPKSLVIIPWKLSLIHI